MKSGAIKLLIAQIFIGILFEITICLATKGSDWHLGESCDGRINPFTSHDDEHESVDAGLPETAHLQHYDGQFSSSSLSRSTLQQGYSHSTYGFPAFDQPRTPQNDATFESIVSHHFPSQENNNQLIPSQWKGNYHDNQDLENILLANLPESDPGKKRKFESESLDPPYFPYKENTIETYPSSELGDVWNDFHHRNIEHDQNKRKNPLVLSTYYSPHYKALPTTDSSFLPSISGESNYVGAYQTYNSGDRFQDPSNIYFDDGRFAQVQHLADHSNHQDTVVTADSSSMPSSSQFPNQMFQHSYSQPQNINMPQNSVTTPPEASHMESFSQNSNDFQTHPTQKTADMVTKSQDHQSKSGIDNSNSDILHNLGYKDNRNEFISNIAGMPAHNPIHAAQIDTFSSPSLVENVDDHLHQFNGNSKNLKWPQLRLDKDSVVNQNPSGEWEESISLALQKFAEEHQGRVQIEESSVREICKPLPWRNGKFEEERNKSTWSRSKKTNFFSDKIRSFIHSDKTWWFNYLLKETHINFQMYQHDVAHDRLFQELFPVYLFFVHLIDEIVPRTVPTLGEEEYSQALKKASTSFVMLAQPGRMLSSSERMPEFLTQAKSKFKIKSRKRKDQLSPILWRFLQAWIKQSRPNLLYMVGNDNDVVNMNFKGFINYTFFTSVHNIMTKIKKELA